MRTSGIFAEAEYPWELQQFKLATEERDGQSD